MTLYWHFNSLNAKLIKHKQTNHILAGMPGYLKLLLFMACVCVSAFDPQCIYMNELYYDWLNKFYLFSANLHNSSILTKLIIMMGMALAIKYNVWNLKQSCISCSFHRRRCFNSQSTSILKVGVVPMYQACKKKSGLWLYIT